jgi:pSer/pThr/pTyr-binding forkhead associated (FHA) protein
METIVGRSSRANIVINNSYVSGQHLSLKAVGNEVMVKDLGSTNGSYIDGQKLQPHVAVPLLPGQRLIIGSEDVVYSL